MLISQSWKETGNRKQEAGENLYSCLLFPASCLLMDNRYTQRKFERFD